MILIITNNSITKKLISKYINIKDCVIDIIDEDFSIYVDKKLMNKNLEKISKIIIDITNFNDKKENILNSVARIKVIYNIQIIIIAIGYKIGDELLSEFFKIGIYDFVISDDNSYQDEELRKSMQGNNYKDALKFKIDNKKNNEIKNLKIKNIKRKKQVSKEKILLTCFSMIKNTFSSVLKLLFYTVIMTLISIGATVIVNSNLRNILIQIIKGM